MKIGKWRVLTVILFVGLLMAYPGYAASKDTLKIGFQERFSTLDHYQSTLRVTIQFGYMVWDSLVTRDPNTGKIYPGLARSWKIIGRTTPSVLSKYHTAASVSHGSDTTRAAPSNTFDV